TILPGTLLAGGFPVDRATLSAWAVDASSTVNAFVRNSIVANDGANACDDMGGTLTSGGFNVFPLAIGCGASAESSDILTADPGLDALTFNGGPTPTLALQADSPAVDQGSCDDADASSRTTD